MNVKTMAILVLATVAAVAIGGCSHGRGVEFGAFGTVLDSKDLDAGYGGGVKAEFNPLDPISVDARVGYVHFDDADVAMVPVEVAGLYNFPILGERIVPYIGAGAGYYHFDAEGANLDDQVGFFPLAGIEIGLQRLSILAEARWLFLGTDVDAAEGELRDLTRAHIDSVGINVGAIYRF